MRRSPSAIEALTLAAVKWVGGAVLAIVLLSALSNVVDSFHHVSAALNAATVAHH